MNDPEVHAGIDLGSENVICVIAEVDEEGDFRITGAGQAPTSGSVLEGVTVDLQGATEAVIKAVREAESISSWKLTEAAVSISGSHVRGFPGRGTVNIEQDDEFTSGKITWLDVEDALETAQMIKLPRESSILRTEKCGYSVDGSAMLPRPPIGLRAERLTADIYMVTADRTSVLNLQQVMRNAGLGITAMYPSAAASARAVLTRDEMEMGVLLADIGAETTDVAVYHSGVLAHLSVIPVGGGTITRDLQQLRLPRGEAERLKRDCISLARRNSEQEDISAAGFGGRSRLELAQRDVFEIVYRSVGGILGDLLCELRQAGIQETDVPAGMVLCGGTSHLEGLAEASSRIMGIPVEVGRPAGINVSSSLIESAEFASAVGLVLLSREEEKEEMKRKGSSSIQKAASKIRGMIRKLR